LYAEITCVPFSRPRPRPRPASLTACPRPVPNAERAPADH
jgi:hypothetical protein